MVLATVGISRLSQRNMPRNFARYTTAGIFWRILLRPGSYSIGISRCDALNMPTIAPTIARIYNTHQWIISRVVAKTARSGEPVFTLMDALLY
jgi:hypothetical protein